MVRSNQAITPCRLRVAQPLVPVQDFADGGVASSSRTLLEPMAMVQRLRARFRVWADLLLPPPKRAPGRRARKQAAA